MWLVVTILDRKGTSYPPQETIRQWDILQGNVTHLEFSESQFKKKKAGGMFYFKIN